MGLIKIYPSQLEKIVLYNDYIPRIISNNEKLKLYHRYYFYDNKEFCKVIDVYNADDIEYYSLRFTNSMQAGISFPIKSQCWELLIDRYGLRSIPNIVNCGESFTGAQIKYWFFINRDLFKGKKYKEFIPYLDKDSKSVISDDKLYFVKATITKYGYYKDCKMQIDWDKEEIRLRRERRKYRNGKRFKNIYN